jgi:hypothetical protein
VYDWLHVAVLVPSRPPVGAASFWSHAEIGRRNAERNSSAQAFDQPSWGHSTPNLSDLIIDCAAKFLPYASQLLPRIRAILAFECQDIDDPKQAKKKEKTKEKLAHVNLSPHPRANGSPDARKPGGRLREAGRSCNRHEGFLRSHIHHK